MNERATESSSLERFQAELAQLTEAYAQASYISYGSNSNPDRIAEQERQSPLLYNDLLDLCARALTESKGDPKTIEIIDRILIWHQYGNGSLLFASSTAAQFYRDLSQRTAQTNSHETTGDPKTSFQGSISECCSKFKQWAAHCRIRIFPKKAPGKG